MREVQDQQKDYFMQKSNILKTKNHRQDMGDLDPSLAALEGMNLDGQDRGDGMDFYSIGQKVDLSLQEQNKYMNKKTAAR